VEEESRLADAGFSDLLDGKAVLVVEWAERFPEALPKERLEIVIEIRGESKRQFTFGGQGPRVEALIRAMEERWR
jgi:tRNA threonylcarbamoyladenosine biosynthesis protein TsaE